MTCNILFSWKKQNVHEEKSKKTCHVQIRGCHGHSKCEIAIKEVLFDWWHSFCYCKNVAVSFVCEKHVVLQFLLWKALGAAISLDWSIWWMVLPIEWSIGSLELRDCWPKSRFQQHGRSSTWDHPYFCFVLQWFKACCHPSQLYCEGLVCLLLAKCLNQANTIFPCWLMALLLIG